MVCAAKLRGGYRVEVDSGCGRVSPPTTKLSKDTAVLMTSSKCNGLTDARQLSGYVIGQLTGQPCSCVTGR